MTFMQLREARNKANEKLGDLYMNAKNRELTAEEKIEEMNLTRELNQLDEQMKFLNRENDNAKAEASKANKAKAFRELLKDVRNGKADREILLRPAQTGDTNAIEASGAINLSIHEMIPTLHEGLGLPVGLGIVTGVTGNEVWPVSINDVEMEEVGEVEALTDQVLNFAQITPTVRRVGLTVPVSNMAIDNAAFDLMAFVQTKFGIALREYIAKKIYSLAAWDGNRGPFANKKASATNIELGADAYKNILQAVAEFSNKGFFEGNVCIAMDRVTEAELMATPKIAGAAGGFVIENGRGAGFPYVVSHFVNTELNSAGKLVATADRYIQIGYWEWFALQQHGDVRLSIDATSQAVAKKNITAVTINTAWSMTDISVYINGANNESQAFGLYKIVEEEPTTA